MTNSNKQISVKALKVIIILVFLRSALPLRPFIRAGSLNEYKCCALNDLRCNVVGAVAARWLKDDKDYREIVGSNSLEFRKDEIQKEGKYMCALRYPNGSITDWGEAIVLLATNISSKSREEVLLNARLEKLEFQFNFNIGQLTLEENLCIIKLYTIGDDSRNTLLVRNLGSNYSLVERIASNGNSIVLTNFSVTLNWTKVQNSFVNNTLQVGLDIRLKKTTSGESTSVLIKLDCTRRVANEPQVFLLNFTSNECTEYQDGQVVKYLLTQNTCLKSDFTMDIECGTNWQAETLWIYSPWTIQLQSLQNALETIAHVLPQDFSTINGSFTTTGTSNPEGNTTVSASSPPAPTSNGMTPNSDDMANNPTTFAIPGGITDTTTATLKSSLPCDNSEMEKFIILLELPSFFMIIFMLFFSCSIFLYVKKTKTKSCECSSVSPNQIQQLLRHVLEEVAGLNTAHVDTSEVNSSPQNSSHANLLQVPLCTETQFIVPLQSLNPQGVLNPQEPQQQADRSNGTYLYRAHRSPHTSVTRKNDDTAEVESMLDRFTEEPAMAHFNQTAENSHQQDSLSFDDDSSKTHSNMNTTHHRQGFIPDTDMPQLP